MQTPWYGPTALKTSLLVFIQAKIMIGFSGLVWSHQQDIFCTFLGLKSDALTQYIKSWMHKRQITWFPFPHKVVSWGDNKGSHCGDSEAQSRSMNKWQHHFTNIKRVSSVTDRHAWRHSSHLHRKHFKNKLYSLFRTPLFHNAYLRQCYRQTYCITLLVTNNNLPGFTVQSSNNSVLNILYTVIPPCHMVWLHAQLSILISATAHSTCLHRKAWQCLPERKCVWAITHFWHENRIQTKQC